MVNPFHSGNLFTECLVLWIDIFFCVCVCARMCVHMCVCVYMCGCVCVCEQADQKLIEVESQLEAFTKTLAAKDAELLKLREDKASTEIALKAALQEKESVDRALDTLKGDMGKVSVTLFKTRNDILADTVQLFWAKLVRNKERYFGRYSSALLGPECMAA